MTSAMLEGSPVDTAYRLLMQRDLAANLQAAEVARAALPTAEGPAVLALHEALVHALDGFLGDVGEHGAQNEALWGIARSSLDLQALLDECAASWAEIKRLRDRGVDSRALTRYYAISDDVPIGSREWMRQMGAAISHRRDPEWIAHVTTLLDEPLD